MGTNPDDWWLRNHPSQDALRDPAALLTQEGKPIISSRDTSFGQDDSLSESDFITIRPA